MGWKIDDPAIVARRKKRRNRARHTEHQNVADVTRAQSMAASASTSVVQATPAAIPTSAADESEWECAIVRIQPLHPLLHVSMRSWACFDAPQSMKVDPASDSQASQSQSSGRVSCAVGLHGSISELQWRSRTETLLEDQGSEEMRVEKMRETEREEQYQQTLAAAAAATAASPSSTLSTPRTPRIPLKSAASSSSSSASKPKKGGQGGMMMLPSAQSLASASNSAGMRSPSSLASTLAAAARIQLCVEVGNGWLNDTRLPSAVPMSGSNVQTTSVKGVEAEEQPDDDGDGDVFVLVPRSRGNISGVSGGVGAGGASSGGAPRASRLVLRPLAMENSTSSAPSSWTSNGGMVTAQTANSANTMVPGTSSMEMEMGARLKRLLNRIYVCKGAVLDLVALGVLPQPTHRTNKHANADDDDNHDGTKDMDTPQLLRFLCVYEASPDCEICQLHRSTQLLLDLRPLPPSTDMGAGSQHVGLLSTIMPSLKKGQSLPSAPALAISASTSTDQTPQSVPATSTPAPAPVAPHPMHPALRALHALLLPPLLFPQAFEHLAIDPPKGLLLSGPPGVGKTYSVQRVCNELGCKLFTMDAASVYGVSSADGDGGGGAVAGAAEQFVRDKFREARAHKGPAVLFIDELDVLCPSRTSEHAQGSRLVAQMLALMDGLDVNKRGQLLIVAATNHPDTLDAALRRPGRFDRELRVDPPNWVQRLEILQFYLRGGGGGGGEGGRPMQLHPSVDLTELAKRCIGYVGADLAALVREAALCAVQRCARQAMKEAKDTEMVEEKGLDEASPPATPTPCLLPEDFMHAQLLVPASSLRGHDVRAMRGMNTANSTTDGSKSNKPLSDWDRIGGLESVKRRLQQAVEWPMIYADTFKALGLKPPRGILLHGPPGCAKTSLVRALASSVHASFFSLDTASLYSSFLGEAERILRELFARARNNAPSVVFLDEIDAMVGKRGMESGGHGSSHGGAGSEAHSLESRILSTLLNELDGISGGGSGGGVDDHTAGNPSVLLVAATNRLDAIDEALLRPGRFDQIVYVPPPDAASRYSILCLHAARMLGLKGAQTQEERKVPNGIQQDASTQSGPISDSHSASNQEQEQEREIHASLSKFAEKLDNYSGADLANLCREAAMDCMRRGKDRVFVSDLERASTTYTPSLNAEMLKRYEQADATATQATGK